MVYRTEKTDLSKVREHPHTDMSVNHFEKLI